MTPFAAREWVQRLWTLLVVGRMTYCIDQNHDYDYNISEDDVGGNKKSTHHSATMEVKHRRKRFLSACGLVDPELDIVTIDTLDRLLSNVNSRLVCIGGQVIFQHFIQARDSCFRSGPDICLGTVFEAQANTSLICNGRDGRIGQ